jgi:hypothetical protein
MDSIVHNIATVDPTSSYNRTRVEAIAQVVRHVQEDVFKQIPEEFIRRTFSQLTDQQAKEFIAALLVSSDNYECKRLGVELKPALALPCVENLLVRAEKYFPRWREAYAAREAFTILTYVHLLCETNNLQDEGIKTRLNQGFDLMNWVHRTT